MCNPTEFGLAVGFGFSPLSLKFCLFLPQGPCDVLSERWIEVGDVLGRIASISQMVLLCVIPMQTCWLLEQRHYAALSPPLFQEKSLPKAEGASLWDCEELALRYVLEDGKLNLYGR